jgi:PelA/Pel-15E family pectate lyase
VAINAAPGDMAMARQRGQWTAIGRALAGSVLIGALMSAPAAAQGLPLEGFEDAIHHWQMKRGDDYPRHAPGDVAAIADNLLLMQRNHGGWVQNRDPLQILLPEGVSQLIAEKAEAVGSFDNRNVFTQIEYLMGAYALTSDARYREGARRGLDYLIRNQFSGCGGWPHTVPPDNDYQGRITVADEVFSGPLILLRRIVEAKPPFDAFDAESRAAARDALSRGEECLLRLQVRQGGVLTGWAGQYDPVTLAPMGGRKFELPALVSQETVAIVKYLMSIREPSLEIVASIDGAVDWLDQVKIDGVRLETVPIPEETAYEYHNAKFDRRLTNDPAAPPLWARFYDLSNNSVVLANRDGIRVERYDQILPERRTGYSWYGEWPASLLSKDFPKWQCRVKGVGPDGAKCP